MNDVEIVLLRFFVDHLVGRKSSNHAVVSARRHSLSNRIPKGLQIRF